MKIPKAKIKKVSKEMASKAKAEIGKMKQKFATAEKKAMTHVKKNPEAALLIAAGVGAAIGAAVAVAMRKKSK